MLFGGCLKLSCAIFFFGDNHFDLLLVCFIFVISSLISFCFVCLFFPSHEAKAHSFSRCCRWIDLPVSEWQGVSVLSMFTSAEGGRNSIFHLRFDLFLFYRFTRSGCKLKHNPRIVVRENLHNCSDSRSTLVHFPRYILRDSRKRTGKLQKWRNFSAYFHFWDHEIYFCDGNPFLRWKSRNPLRAIDHAEWERNRFSFLRMTRAESGSICQLFGEQQQSVWRIGRVLERKAIGSMWICRASSTLSQKGLWSCD